MTVRIVTDSTADLPPALARELNITVVPLIVRFGEETYRDGVDLTTEAFYQRLAESATFPSTSQPSVGDFLSVYERLARDTDQVLSVHISSKLSGTVNSALQASKELEGRCRIEVMDSAQASMTLGMVATAAAREAAGGSPLETVRTVAEEACARMRLYCLLDTLEYLKMGGRIGRVQAFLGSLLSIKPIISVQDGLVVPMDRPRTRARGLDRLVELAQELAPLSEAWVCFSTTPDEAQELAQRVSPLVSTGKVGLTQLGPVLGSHLGPGALGLTTMREG